MIVLRFKKNDLQFSLHPIAFNILKSPTPQLNYRSPKIWLSSIRTLHLNDKLHFYYNCYSIVFNSVSYYVKYFLLKIVYGSTSSGDSGRGMGGLVLSQAERIRTPLGHPSKS